LDVFSGVMTNKYRALSSAEPVLFFKIEKNLRGLPWHCFSHLLN
jgi:hypothetical protein